MSRVGVTETSRSVRNNINELASIAEAILKEYARLHVAQFTFDNLDIRINYVTHHLTLNYLEFEQHDLSMYCTDAKPFEEFPNFFRKDILLLDAEENKELFDHYKYVVAVTLGQLFGKEVDGMSWLLSVLPKHYSHQNSNTAVSKALIHVDEPMYLQETKNSDMFKIMHSLQLRYLNLLIEQAEDMEQTKEDINLLSNSEVSVTVREEAEKRMKLVEKKAGVLICHGDQLTKERFENCKRLAQSGVTALERFEFMPVFRLGMFHLRMNKSIQDLECGMPTLVNVEDDLSLGYMRTVLGLTYIREGY